MIMDPTNDPFVPNPGELRGNPDASVIVMNLISLEVNL